MFSEALIAGNSAVLSDGMWSGKGQRVGFGERRIIGGEGTLLIGVMRVDTPLE
jgi:hypothetical protein